MTEDEARQWLSDRFPADTCRQLERYVDLLLTEAEQQSLIARSTFAEVWARHIVDSAQLAALGGPGGSWLDVGSGGGLPGIVLAIVMGGAVHLCEPRSRRAVFLQTCAQTLGLDNVTVSATTVQRVCNPGTTIVARAVSHVCVFMDMVDHLVSRETCVILPRGRSAESDLAALNQRWKGVFHVEQSITDPSAGILVLRGTQRR